MPYPPKNSSAPSPDSATVTCSAAFLARKYSGTSAGSATGSSRCQMIVGSADITSSAVTRGRQQPDAQMVRRVLGDADLRVALDVEADRERRDLGVDLARERDDRGRVDAAGQERADRHVGPQVQRGRYPAGRRGCAGRVPPDRRSGSAGTSAGSSGAWRTCRRAGRRSSRRRRPGRCRGAACAGSGTYCSVR